LVVDSNQRRFRKATPAMNYPMPPLPGLSLVSGKTIVVIAQAFLSLSVFATRTGLVAP
jgi:hypothetical protein